MCLVPTLSLLLAHVGLTPIVLQVLANLRGRERKKEEEERKKEEEEKRKKDKRDGRRNELIF